MKIIPDFLLFLGMITGMILFFPLFVIMVVQKSQIEKLVNE